MLVLQDLTFADAAIATVDRYARPRVAGGVGAGRASELVALNNAPFPFFLPTSGKALAARMTDQVIVT
jgi:hypothetical protein